jgi:hypothetical protein
MKINPKFAALRNRSHPMLDMLNDEKLYRDYGIHFRNSKRRGIEFDMSYEEWLLVWTASGKLHLRGRQPGQYCMSRFNDTGGYTVENVEIISIEQNTYDRHAGRSKSPEHRAKLAKTLCKVRHHAVVDCDGLIFESATAAGKHFGITPQAVLWRIKSGGEQFKNWKMVKMMRGGLASTPKKPKCKVIPFRKQLTVEDILSPDYVDESIDYQKLAEGDWS